jgi:hypothetical protein
MKILRSCSWRSFAIFLAFTWGFAIFTWSGVLFTNKALDWLEESAYLASLIQRSMLNYFAAYILVTLVDGTDLRGRARTVALFLALLIGTLLSVQARCAVSPYLSFYAYENTMLRYCTSLPTWRTYLDFPASWMQPFTVAGIVMIFIFTRRRDSGLIERLHQARASELEVQRQRIESEIEAMHARVDPDGLQSTLRAIRDKYESSLKEGEEMLDRLIDDLRQAARHPLAGAAPAGED